VQPLDLIVVGLFAGCTTLLSKLQTPAVVVAAYQTLMRLLASRHHQNRHPARSCHVSVSIRTAAPPPPKREFCMNATDRTHRRSSACFFVGE